MKMEEPVSVKIVGMSVTVPLDILGPTVTQVSL